MIAFLHTSDIHIKRFEEIVSRFDETIETRHFVNEELLADALQSGKVDGGRFERQINKIRQFSPELIICTCSTLGSECDRFDDVHRIDFPIAEFLVKNYKTIALAYAAHSTRKSSLNLLQSIVSSEGRDVCIVEIDCTECWAYLEEGDINKYHQEIGKILSNVESGVEVIFLAQASMEKAREYIQNIDIPVMASTEFGMKVFLEGV